MFNSLRQLSHEHKNIQRGQSLLAWQSVQSSGLSSSCNRFFEFNQLQKKIGDRLGVMEHLGLLKIQYATKNYNDEMYFEKQIEMAIWTRTSYEETVSCWLGPIDAF